VSVATPIASAATRYLAAAAASGLIVMAIFVLIGNLVARDAGGLVGASARSIDFSRTPRHETPRVASRSSPRKPEPPTRSPSFARIAELPVIQVPVLPLESALPALAIAPAPAAGPVLRGDGHGVGGDSDVIPLFRDAPRYPREALMNHVEGWVEIEFTIAPDGTVKDPVVVGAQPERVFEHDALRAIARWKFQPFVVGGVALDRRARQIIEFTLKPI
jgi:protein TonB